MIIFLATGLEIRLIILLLAITLLLLRACGATHELPLRNDWIKLLRLVLSTPFDIMCNMSLSYSNKNYQLTMWEAVFLLGRNGLFEQQQAASEKTALH